jgi:hypothetical protein
MEILFCRRAILAVACLLMSQGCSIYMEATRPTPIALDEYQIGQSRDSVLERLGAPETTAKESDGANCDFYKLYTRGYGAGGKIPLAVAEGAADFFTLGLAEIILTPTEGVTKNEKHPVAFCYKSDRVARITTDTGPSASSAQAALSDTPAAASAPAPAEQVNPLADSPAQTATSAASTASTEQSVANAALTTSPTPANEPPAQPAAGTDEVPKVASPQ